MRAVHLLTAFAAPLLAVVSGCSETPSLTFNQAPTVTLTSGPIDTLSAPLTWVVDITWTASDPDGSIDRFEYAIDPPMLRQALADQAETTWIATRETRATVRFRASNPDTVGPGATASEFHTFVLRAVDDQGAVSPLVVRAFYAYTVAPDVQITDPAPNRFFRTRVGLPFRLSWTGNDPDGAGSTRPSEYRVLVINGATSEWLPFLADPDSLRRLAIQTGWADWRSVPGESTSVVVQDASMTAGSSGLVALVAVDEAGASTPYMSLDRNLLNFTVLPNAAPGIHVVSPFMDYRTDYPVILSLPGYELPSNQSHTLRWEGLPSAGRRVVFSRWMLDGDVADPAPRSDEATDWVHWSEPQGGEGSATFGPLAAGEHRLFIELRDDAGSAALFTLKLVAVTPSLDRDLLVVDDTRFEPDKFFGDPTRQTPDAYQKRWPSSTELDTFLFARGGFPWRGTRNPTTGVTSSPGLFAGYSFDTLGTRRGLEDPARAVPLSSLLSYRHVVWLVDVLGASYPPSLDQSLFPITALRAMCLPGRPNSLAAYLSAGGKVWLAGGGAGLASLAGFDAPANNSGVTFLFDIATGELGPGRVLHDAGHVRSAFSVTSAPTIPQRLPAALGGWSGHGPDGTLSAPDYSRLPAELRPRSAGSDPLPPTRLASQGGLFHFTSDANEYISRPNEIAEDMDPDPDVVRLESTLDSLYEVSSPQITAPRSIAMFYYHGRDNPPFVFTGLPVWGYTRSDCQALVDFVLQDLWGLSRSGPLARPGFASAAPSRRAAPARASSVQRR